MYALSKSKQACGIMHLGCCCFVFHDLNKYKSNVSKLYELVFMCLSKSNISAEYKTKNRQPCYI